MEMYKNIPTCYANDAAVWSEWFRLNMQKYNAVLYKKGCGTPSITYDEAVNVARCYGWIDSKINKRDEISWYQYFAKRNPKRLAINMKAKLIQKPKKLCLQHQKQEMQKTWQTSKF